MTSSHLVAFHDLTLLGDIDTDELVDTRLKTIVAGQLLQTCTRLTLWTILVIRLLGEVEFSITDTAAVLMTAEHLDVDNLALLTVWNTERNITGVFCLLTEDRDNQALFRRQLSLTLRRDFTD